MNVKKLFRVLVMGGSVIGAAAALPSLATEQKDLEMGKSSKNKKGHDVPDAGQPQGKEESGGGAKGW